MSVLDKFLNVIKLNDDDEFEEEDFLDEEVEEEREVAPRSRVIKKRDDDLFQEPSPYEDDDNDSREDEGSGRQAPASSSKNRFSPSRRSSGELGKVSPIRSRRRNEGSSGMKVCVIRPHSMEDAREITDSLLSECTVVLNVEGLELELAQRIIDFSAGSCYAIDGNLQKVSTYIFVITPSSVDLTGDFQELLSDAFDVPFERR